MTHTLPAIQPTRYRNRAIGEAISEPRDIEPLVSGSRRQHRYAVKHTTDELGEQRSKVK